MLFNIVLIQIWCVKTLLCIRDCIYMYLEIVSEALSHKSFIPFKDRALQSCRCYFQGVQ